MFFDRLRNTMLAPNTLGGDQRPHFSICGFLGLNQRVGVGGDIDE